MTEFLISGPAMGKTTAAVNWARGGPRRQIVTVNEVEAGRVRHLLMHPEIGSPVYDARKVISLAQLNRGDGNDGPVKYNELVVDNLDMMLATLFRLPVSLVTARGVKRGMNHYSTW